MTLYKKKWIEKIRKEKIKLFLGKFSGKIFLKSHFGKNEKCFPKSTIGTIFLMTPSRKIFW